MKISARKKSNESFPSDLDLRLSIGNICTLHFYLAIFFSVTSQEGKKKKAKLLNYP